MTANQIVKATDRISLTLPSMETKLTVTLVLVLEITLCGNPTNCPVNEDHFKGNSSVKATVGGDITLPCEHFTDSKDVTVLEWIKGSEDVVFSSREGYPVVHESFKDKVSPTPSKEENWALGLRRVKESDQAEYCCCVMVGSGDKTCSSVSLSVTEEEVTEKPDDWKDQKTTSDKTGNDLKENPTNHHTIIAIAIIAIVVIIGIYCKCGNSKKKTESVSQTGSNEDAASAPSASSQSEAGGEQPDANVQAPLLTSGQSKHLRKRLTSSSSSSSGSQTSEQNSGTPCEQSNDLPAEDSDEMEDG